MVSVHSRIYIRDNNIKTFLGLLWIAHSDYCVELTYGIYSKNTTLIPLHVVNHEEESTLHRSLSALVQNTKFLSDGSYLRFGLRYMHRVVTNSETY